jgi:hypothetical protein
LDKHNRQVIRRNIMNKVEEQPIQDSWWQTTYSIYNPAYSSTGNDNHIADLVPSKEEAERMTAGSDREYYPVEIWWKLTHEGLRAFMGRIELKEGTKEKYQHGTIGEIRRL